MASLLDSFNKYPEILPIAIYVVMLAIAGFQGQIGKALYWFGAIILTVGILLMKG